MGVKCFLPDSGVEEFPALSTEQLEQAAAELAAVDGLLLVHAEDPGVLAAAPEPAGRSYARFLASRPAQAEDTAIETASRRRPAYRSPAARRAPVQRLRAARARRRQGRRGPGDGRDLPALPRARGRAGARRRDRDEVLPAGARRGQPGRALGRPRRRDHRPGGQRPLAVHARPQGAGHRRLRHGLGRHLVGAARPAAGLDRGPPARPRPGRRRALDVVGTRGAGRARHQGRHPGRCGRRPGGLRPGRRPRGRPGPAAPPQPGVAVRRCAADRRGALDVVGWDAGRDVGGPRGRLLARGEA